MNNFFSSAGCLLIELGPAGSAFQWLIMRVGMRWWGDEVSMRGPF
jgi:hypothetical protein